MSVLHNPLRFGSAAAALLAALVASSAAWAAEQGTTVVKYDVTSEAAYLEMWANIYGPLELAAGGTRTVGKSGTTVSAVPFSVGADFSVFDHLKYIGVSTQSFDVPLNGSL